ncbi:electron transport complex, RnfABCDGE type, G subunit [Candidatus Ruthia magnifica str. Cm (Calyptogena magnifica)]|uniref:Ion-translocating oxidoreductase complex subunit G n=1 Tax=Ruthia magnifica subsp. Calyptogena magnifica TaxID=413404 RepID=A1AVI0_RUTMC|nr:electron transport complex subunit RsxG [Candidatus Ruthturnera calyptogenae]ABL01937.1 electron transport complex, RnfABCDGE type, G subunit [Candidatus Ruthia magnifica str. Cm (Calyptogena magnifica)]
MLHAILKSGALLFVFTVVSVFFVSLTQTNTKDVITYNEKQLLIQRLGELVSDYSNDILADQYTKTLKLHNVTQVVNIYPAKKNHKIFSYLIEHTYPNGYNGDIRLLTGVGVDKKLLGVRVIIHKETPGLGDKIELKKSNWIEQFFGLSLSNPSMENWKVKRDGGVFDAFTGATITPRAIVTATYQVLELLNEPCLLSKTPCN